MQDTATIETFCTNLVRDQILPVLQDNYNALKANSEKHGAQFFEDPNSAANFKQDGKGLVSKGEVEAERLIRQAFTKTFPDFSVYGEELGDEQDSTKPCTLVIDPVDGTAAMIRSVIEPDEPLGFGITLGFLEKNNFIGGLIYELLPNDKTGLALGNIWSGWQGKPTTLNGQTIKISPEENSSLEHLICTAPEVMFTTPQAQHAFHALEKTAHKIITGRNCMGFTDAIQALNCCAIETDLSIHDIAALIPILRGAGLTSTTLKGQPIVFQGIDHAYTILSAPPKLHKTTLEFYQKALQEPPQNAAENSTLNCPNTLNTQKFKTGTHL